MPLKLGDSLEADTKDEAGVVGVDPAAAATAPSLSLGDSIEPEDLPLADDAPVSEPEALIGLSLGDEIGPERSDTAVPDAPPSGLSFGGDQKADAPAADEPPAEPHSAPPAAASEPAEDAAPPESAEPAPVHEPVVAEPLAGEPPPEAPAAAEEKKAQPARPVQLPEGASFSVAGLRPPAGPVQSVEAASPVAVPEPPQGWAFSVTGFRSSGKPASAFAPRPPEARPAPQPMPPPPAAPKALKNAPPSPPAPPRGAGPGPGRAGGSSGGGSQGGGSPGGSGSGGRGGPPGGKPPTGGGGGPPSGAGGGQSGGGQQGGGLGRIGDKLVEMGLISPDQLHVALLEKRTSSKMLGEILVDLGFITEQALAAVLAEASGFQRFDPSATIVDAALLKKLTKEAALRYRVFPVSMEGGVVRVAMADVYDVLALDQLTRAFGANVEIQPLVCGETDIQKAIDQYYGHELSIDGILRELETSTTAEDISLLSQEGAYTHPIVRLVDAIMLDAVKQKASDVHLEPEGNFLRVRYRIDGEMTQIRTIHKRHWPAFSHRLKLMSGMNIADKMNSQDGRFSMAMGSQSIDFRVSSLPTVHGENLVLRILDKSAAQVPLESLGYTRENFELLTRMAKRPEGIIIVTGPTGSGKTTTLYAIMTYINSLSLNIMTLEDPVEYELSLIRQSQIREGTSMTFADGIRSLMRQDPDVILVGEIRDAETARMALRAAMTGHQVYTTLHTNDAAGAIPRLIDLGMSPTLMSGNVIGIVAQRLSRKLCDECKAPRPATPEECRILGVDADEPPVIYEPVGCSTCRGTGHKGRVAVSEILPFNDTIDEMIIRGETLPAIRREGEKIGFVSLVEDGVRKVLEGTLSIPALMRCVDVTDRL